MSIPTVLDALQDSYPPVSESDIQNMERELGSKLPDDYIAFLLQHNGGDFQHDVEFLFERPVGDYSERISIQKLSGITADPDDVNDLRWGTRHSRIFVQGQRRQLIPIAGTWWLGEQICLGASGPEFGQVFLAVGIFTYRIADTFTQFLERIRLVEDPAGNFPNARTPDLQDDEADKIAIFQAIRCGDLATVQDYLARSGDVNSRTPRGTTLLMYAVHHSWPKIVKLLLDHGAAVHSRDKAGEDAIFKAVRAQSLDSVNLLFAAGANPDSQNNEGVSLVGQAHIMLRSRIYRTLVEHGAKPDPAKEAVLDE